MATLRKIAELAGVSFKTVSRVVNNDPNVAEGTYARVKKIIDEVGYHPNITARGLVQNRTFLIGLVIPEITSAAFSLMIEGMEREAAPREYHIVLCSTGSERAKEEATVAALTGSRRVDGILLVSNRINPSYFPKLKTLDVPTVLIDRELDDEEMPQVFTNNREGIFKVTTHLIETGRKRIAYITPVIDTSTSLERLEGYERAMREHGLDYDGRILVDHAAQRNAGFSTMLQLLGRRNPPDGVVGFNDLLAIGAMEAIKARGLRVPEDVAVAGFDDIEAASMVDPPLTTVRQPLAEIGSTACRMLIDLIAGKQPETTRVAFDTQLVVRRSSGALPGEVTQ